MKSLFFTFILSALLITNAQTIYYVSSSQGNDSNSGLSSSSPFKTLSKVNSLQLNPGDKVLFKDGDIWQGQNLIISSSGTAQNSIIFSSYGTGIKPIISLKEPIPNWNISGTWTSYGDDIWYMTMPLYSQYDPIQRLWINGTEVLLANGISGDNGDGSSGVCYSHPFYQNNSGTLYVYSTSNPALAYSSLTYPGGGASGIKLIYHTVALQDADYITIQGLDIRGGMYSAVGLAGSNYDIFKDCNIGKYSNWAGLYGNSGFINSSGKSSNYIEIANDTINSDWNYPYYFYTQRTPYGIVAGNNASFWTIHDNFVKDWWMNIYLIATSGSVLYPRVFSNQVTSPDFSLSKGMQISGNIQNSSGSVIGAEVYNNHFYTLTNGIQITSAQNKIFGNIFSNLGISSNIHASSSNSGWGIQILSNSLETMTPDSNYIVNNTFFNTTNNAIVDFTGGTGHEFYYNNLFVNCATNLSYHYQVQDNTYSGNTWKNNLFFYPGLSVTDKLISISGTGAYSASEFNLLNNLNGKTISGNIQYAGLTGNLLNTNNFTLPSGSPALNAGTDINSLVPSGFKDLYGNLVNTQQPNIGATAGGTNIGSNPAPVLNFFSNKNTITSGQSATLSWSSQNATQLDLQPGIGNVSTQGSISVSPQATTTYTLTANGNGGSASSSVTISVTASVQTPTVSLSASAPTITKGQSVTLTWTSKNASQLNLQPGIGSVASSGSITVSPQSTTIYSLVVQNSSGTDTAKVTVTVNAAIITPPSVVSGDLTADRTSILKGQSVNLSWTTQNASTVSIQPGIGNVSSSGSKSVSPSATITYTLLAIDGNDTAKSSITINVSTVAPSPTELACNLTADKNVIQKGQSAKLKWTSQNAAKLVLEPTVGQVNAQDSIILTPKSTTTYTLTAIANGDSVTSKARVIIVNPVPTKIRIKVLLEGPYKNGVMLTSLNNDNLLPNTQPYRREPWNYTGRESVGSFPSNIVDWVLVQLRTGSSPSSIVAEQAALLRNDGIITDVNTNDYLTFNNLLPGNYYIVIEHRNHLPIMSSGAITVPDPNIIFYDFTTSEGKAYGDNAEINLGNGSYGMYGGDTDANGIIDSSDVNYIGTFMFQTGYNNSDADMNGTTNVLDYKMPKINDKKSAQISP